MKIITARRKPIELECMQYAGDDNRQQIIDWSGGDCYYVCFGRGSSFKCKTREGDINISVGDYVMRGVKGEHYPCKSDIFPEIYDIVGERNEAQTKIDETIGGSK